MNGKKIKVNHFRDPNYSFDAVCILNIPIVDTKYVKFLHIDKWYKNIFITHIHNNHKNVV